MQSMYRLKCGCSDACMDKLPDITFMLGKQKFSLPPESYIIKVCTHVLCNIQTMDIAEDAFKSSQLYQ